METKIIVLPGWMHTRRHWYQTSCALAQLGIDADIIDIPGFGDQPILSDKQTFADIVTYVQTTILKKYPDENLLIVGHSFGGRIAVEIASSLPNLKKIVLIGTPVIYRPSFQLRLQKILFSILAPVKSHIPESWKNLIRSDDYELAKHSGMQTLISETIMHDQTQTLKEISTSVDILWGENDQQVPTAIAKETHELLPSSALEIVANVGHNIHIEKPQLLAAKIQSYANF